MRETMKLDKALDSGTDISVELVLGDTNFIEVYAEYATMSSTEARRIADELYSFADAVDLEEVSRG